jgi:transposase
MAGQRKRYSADFKAKVALEAIRGELTIAQLVAKHGVHQTLIHGWKKQALDGMAGVFSAKAETHAPVGAAEIEKLHTKIGELVVERDPGSGSGTSFLRKSSGR